MPAEANNLRRNERRLLDPLTEADMVIAPGGEGGSDRAYFRKAKGDDRVQEGAEEPIILTAGCANQEFPRVSGGHGATPLGIDRTDSLKWGWPVRSRQCWLRRKSCHLKIARKSCASLADACDY